MAASAQAIFCCAGVAVLGSTCAQAIGITKSERTAKPKVFISSPFREQEPGAVRFCRAAPRLKSLREGPASGLSWIDVTAIAAARAIRQIGELRPKRRFVHVDPIAEAVVGEVVEAGDQDASHGYA